MVLWLSRVYRHAKTVRRNEDNSNSVGEVTEIIATQVGGGLRETHYYLLRLLAELWTN